MTAGAPRSTLFTKSEIAVVVIRLASEGIAPSSIAFSLGRGPTASWQMWHVPLTTFSPRRSALIVSCSVDDRLVVAASVVRYPYSTSASARCRGARGGVFFPPLLQRARR